MAYTFGAGTGDDVTWTGSISLGATARASLVYGWWLPTTLTATRGLWSAGNVYGAEVDLITDELTLRTDGATTDGQWSTTGVDLAVDEWKFIACFGTSLSGTPDMAWRVWAGTIGSAPVEVTVTNIIPQVGNFAGSAVFYLGNKGTGTVAFEGDIDEAGFIATAASATAGLPFGLAAYGACTDTEAAFIYQRFVLPLWLGEFPRQAIWSAIGTPSTEHAHISLRSLPQVRRTASSDTVLSGVAPTINGATVSQNRGPRPYNDSPTYRERYAA